VVVGVDKVSDVVEGVGVYLIEEIGAFLLEVGLFLSAPNLMEPVGPKLKQDDAIGAVTSCTEVSGGFRDPFRGLIGIPQLSSPPWGLQVYQPAQYPR
jgi:hypothetical protein